jgi:hypothetical protein
MVRFYRAYGQSYSLKARALEAEDYRKLSTLAKLERQRSEQRQAIARVAHEGVDGEIIEKANAKPGERVNLRKLVDSLQRQEARIKRMRTELIEVLA